MATVVITFFLFVPYYVYKMDAEYIDSQRDQDLSRREKRWSMNSQRLDEIVAELMKPISDVRRSFDTDLCALLEEYLTEAGLHALDSSDDGAALADGAPNFAELALLLQQSASIYGRKVDFLYQHVLNVSDSLHTGTQEAGAASSAEEPQTPTTGRRKRRASGPAAFGDIALEAAGAARREAEAARPPPTLPRMYLELEPRVLAPGDAPLLDYAAEPIGLLADFHVAWRLHEGLLVDELEHGGGGSAALRPLSLLELQAAIHAAAPPPPSPGPRRASTPLAAAEPAERDEPPPPAEERLAPPAKRERKRRSDVKIDDIVGGAVKILISKELRRKLSEAREFSVPEEWLSQLVAARKSHILSQRRRLRAHSPRPPNIDFRGFDLSDAQDVGGFAGWSSSEAERASLAPGGGRGCDAAPDSDDDGFFERSSLGDSDTSRADESIATAVAGAEGGDGADWRATLETRAAEAAARSAPDVRQLGAALLRQLADASRAAPFASVLRGAARHESDVSRLLLASLFLANAGNVEIERGPPLSVGSFSLRLLSTDERLYCAVAAAEPPQR